MKIAQLRRITSCNRLMCDNKLNAFSPFLCAQLTAIYIIEYRIVAKEQNPLIYSV